MPQLILKRKPGESIVLIVDGKRILIESRLGHKIRTVAPESVRILRGELHEEQYPDEHKAFNDPSYGRTEKGGSGPDAGTGIQRAVGGDIPQVDSPDSVSN